MIYKISGISAQYSIPVVLRGVCIEKMDEIISPHFAKGIQERGCGDIFVRTAWLCPYSRQFG
jgi:hypothetical protein